MDNEQKIEQYIEKLKQFDMPEPENCYWRDLWYYRVIYGFDFDFFRMFMLELYALESVVDDFSLRFQYKNTRIESEATITLSGDFSVPTILKLLEIFQEYNCLNILEMRHYRSITLRIDMEFFNPTLENKS